MICFNYSVDQNEIYHMAFQNISDELTRWWGQIVVINANKTHLRLKLGIVKFVSIKFKKNKHLVWGQISESEQYLIISQSGQWKKTPFISSPTSVTNTDVTHNGQILTYITCDEVFE